MGGLREDGLPIPIDGTQLYLAAILDELRGTRSDRVPPASEDELVDVREPETAALEDVGAPVPTAAVKKRTAKKPTARKRRATQKRAPK